MYLKYSFFALFIVLMWQDGQYCIPKPFHFFPEEFHHMVTIIYPESFSDSKLGGLICDLLSVMLSHSNHCRPLAVISRGIF